MCRSAIRFLSLSSVTLSGALLAYAARAQEMMAEGMEPVAEHHAPDAGLPQLDVSTYANQLFWLVITGLILYVLMARVALPRVQQIMRARDEFVHDHLHKAAGLRKQSENAKVDYDLAIRQAEQRAKDFLATTTADLKAKHDQATQDLLKNVAERTHAAEQRVQAEKDAIMANLDDHAGRLAHDIMLTIFDTKPGATA